MTTTLKQDEIIETAIQGHASTRDAIRWAMNQEREACAKVCDDIGMFHEVSQGADLCFELGKAIRARGTNE